MTQVTMSCAVVYALSLRQLQNPVGPDYGDQGAGLDVKVITAQESRRRKGNKPEAPSSSRFRVDDS